MICLGFSPSCTGRTPKSSSRVQGTQHVADISVRNIVRISIERSRSPVDDNKLIAAVQAHEARSRMHRQRRASYDERVGLLDLECRAIQEIRIEVLLIQHDIRLDDAFAGRAERNRARIAQDGGQRILEPAVHAIVAVNRSVQLQHAAAAGKLMQAVDILGDDRRQPALLLQPSQRSMRGIGKRFGIDHMGPVKGIEISRMLHEKVPAQNLFRQIRFARTLLVQPVRRAEIGNPAFRGGSRPAEKYDAPAVGQNRLQIRLLHAATPSSGSFPTFTPLRRRLTPMQPN
ncbi:hypothetical protein BN871_AC_00390 [Paenibacillus sp. P22]|nr:hypothetical protein BN871_AC_00390 [Paenibacillus sp. P22]